MTDQQEKQQIILTIDDERSIRESFRNFLEDYDYKVIEAENGRTGLQMVEAENPDLILADLRMPEVDGLEVLAWVRGNRPDTPIIVISGTGVISDVVEALHLGAWDYLLKPIEDLTVLRHAIEKCLERCRLLRENREYREQLEEKVKLRTAQLEAANRELKETRMQVIRRLGKAAEYKDNETGKHVIRVGYYAGILAEALGLDTESVDLIRLCGPMHDLGKIGIPDRILLKEGPLEAEEWTFMQSHTLLGEEMLKPLSPEEVETYRKHTRIGEDILGGDDSRMLQTARNIAAYHHERWDGSGYPYGLEGEDIPVEARIIALADIYDALSSKRSYKEPFPEDECQKIIRELSGTFLEPRIVDLFFANIEKIQAVKNEWAD